MKTDNYYYLNFSFLPTGYQRVVLRSSEVSVTFAQDEDACGAQVGRSEAWVHKILERMRRYEDIAAHKHEYAMFDGSLYKSVRAALSEEELKERFEAHLQALTQHYRKLRNGLRRGSLVVRSPDVYKADPQRLDSDLVSIFEKYELNNEEIYELRARRSRMRDARIQELCATMDRSVAVSKAFAEFKKLDHVKLLEDAHTS